MDASCDLSTALSRASVRLDLRYARAANRVTITQVAISKRKELEERYGRQANYAAKVCIAAFYRLYVATKLSFVLLGSCKEEYSCLSGATDRRTSSQKRTKYYSCHLAATP